MAEILDKIICFYRVSKRALPLHFRILFKLAQKICTCLMIIFDFNNLIFKGIKESASLSNKLSGIPSGKTFAAQPHVLNITPSGQ